MAANLVEGCDGFVSMVKAGVCFFEMSVFLWICGVFVKVRYCLEDTSSWLY